MKIDEAQIKKRIIERQILSLIQQFEKDVGLEVSYICLENLNVMGAVPSTVHVELEVKL